MPDPILQVKMLGNFSLAYGDCQVTDQDNRSKKVWLLLAYMIYNRNRLIPQDNLVSLLWTEETVGDNPLNALKTVFHRVRSHLDRLFPSAGLRLIIRRDGTYAWNSDFPLTFDVEEFDRLCNSGVVCEDADRRLQYYLEALEYYKGDFLPKLSSEAWVIPISTHFHNMYLQVVQETTELLRSRNRLQEVAQLCRQALQIDPYNEELYQCLMSTLLDLGDQKGVIQIYNKMNDLLFSNFGIMPSEESKALYRKAAATVNEQELSVSLLMEQLRENDCPPGAMYCEYDFFRAIYHNTARAILRTGNAVHLSLITVSGAGGKALSKRSLAICMENLKELMCASLRRGDLITRCSATQYIVMLPQANYENACMVMERTVRSFFRQYPHSPAELKYSVLPLEPML